MSRTHAGTHREVGTLFGVPRGDGGGALVTVLGIPFDMGYHSTRIGGRNGPAHIRSHSRLVREAAEDLGIDPVTATGLVDQGDLDLVPGQVEEAFARIEAAILDILDVGSIPLTLGGDGAVSLPQLRAVHRRFGPVTLLHFDAHTDAYNWNDPFPYNNANSFVRASEERLVLVDESWHVGIRDTAAGGESGVIQVAKELGYGVVTMTDIEEYGVDELVRKLRAQFQGRQIYLCWDMDVFDPSAAPGVVTPAWGGLTVREGLRILRGLRGLDVVSFDLNTVSPPHDIGGQTGSLAAQVALEFLQIALHRPEGSTADNPTTTA